MSNFQGIGNFGCNQHPISHPAEITFFRIGKDTGKCTRLFSPIIHIFKSKKSTEYILAISPENSSISTILKSILQTNLNLHKLIEKLGYMQILRNFMTAL